MSENDYISLPDLERHPVLSGCFVYYLYRGVDIVYVGSTSSLYTRVSSHLNTKDFDSYSFFEVNEDERFDIEAREILKYLPVMNKSLPPSMYWSQKKSKSNGVYARYFKHACIEDGCVVFLGTVYVKSEHLIRFIGAEL